MKSLTDIELSRLLKVSRQTLITWRGMGKGPPFFRLGRAVRYLESDVLAFIEHQRV